MLVLDVTVASNSRGQFARTKRGVSENALHMSETRTGRHRSSDYSGKAHG